MQLEIDWLRTEQMTNYEILKAIKNGTHQEKYEDWKTHYYSDIRKELAKQGYFHEELIFDKHHNVRDMVLETNPDTIMYIIDNPEYERFLACYFEDQTEPNIEYLTMFLDNFAPKNNQYPTLKVKLAALTTQPTVFEATMTSKQLYYAQSPLWAKLLNPKQIEYVIRAQDTIDKGQRQQNEINPILEAIDTNPQKMWPCYAAFLYKL